MSAASVAFERLSLAMLDSSPECLGIGLFTADDLSKSDVDVCAAICATCPLFDACRAYAELERPKAGVWAARTYRTNKKKGETS